MMFLNSNLPFFNLAPGPSPQNCSTFAINYENKYIDAGMQIYLVYSKGDLPHQHL